MRKRTPRKWTFEKVKETIESPSGNGCTLITTQDEYISGSEKLKIRCKCLEPFETKILNFIHKKKPKKQCNNCGKKMKITPIEEIIHYIQSNSSCTFIKVVSKKYSGYKSKLLLKCECKELFKVSFNEFKNGSKTMCNKCNKHVNWDTLSVKEYIEIKSKSGCTLIGEYRGHRNKIKLKCRCSEHFPIAWSQFLKGQHHCKKCSNLVRSKRLRLSYKALKNIANSKGCKLSCDYNQYKNNSSIISFQCTCGEIFSTTIKSFTDKHNPKDCCDRCSNFEKKSKGSIKIKKYLIRKNFNFEQEYTFKDCRNILPLPFDFAVFENGELKCLIEYDGKQHFEPVKFWGGKEAFLYRKKNDAVKDNYCKNRDLNLIRIPYWEYNNIVMILDRIFRRKSDKITQ
jgi:hypothetical protein